MDVKQDILRTRATTSWMSARRKIRGRGQGCRKSISIPSHRRLASAPGENCTGKNRHNERLLESARRQRYAKRTCGHWDGKWCYEHDLSLEQQDWFMVFKNTRYYSVRWTGDSSKPIWHARKKRTRFYKKWCKPQYVGRNNLHWSVRYLQPLDTRKNWWCRAGVHTIGFAPM